MGLTGWLVDTSALCDARLAARTSPLASMPVEFLTPAVLHLDEDFELIAATTGQPVERLRLEPA